MIEGLLVLATICARGGSKGVKNKNIRLLGEKPLIQYSLDLISGSRYIDDYVISTDSEEIIEVVKTLGFRIDFVRPSELAGDKVSRIDAIRHAVEWKEKKLKERFDIIIDFGVATPFKSVKDADGSLEMLIECKAENVFSVSPSARNPYYNMVEIIDDTVRTVKQLDEHITDRRDALKVFDMNDGFNVWMRDTLFTKSPQFNKNTKIFIMPRERSVDIDEEIDFAIAETLLKIKKHILY